MVKICGSDLNAIPSSIPMVCLARLNNSCLRCHVEHGSEGNGTCRSLSGAGSRDDELGIEREGRIEARGRRIRIVDEFARAGHAFFQADA